MINLGGNVLTVGNKPDGKPFHIGIQETFWRTKLSIIASHSRGPSHLQSYLQACMSDISCRTVKSITIFGFLTGYQKESNLLSVTIISDSPLTAMRSQHCLLYF